MESNEYTKQAQDFLDKHGIKFHATFKGDKCPLWCDGKHVHGDRYLVSFTRKDFKPGHNTNYARFSLSFWNSLNDSQARNEPTSYDVLAAIQKYDVGTFEDFCSEFGYDTDSRKAYTSYKLVVKEYQKVSGFFSDSELEELQEIN